MPDGAPLTHWGSHALAALTAHGVDTLFTLSGGHLFLLYDAARAAGVRLVDVRHEQTAGFAAEAWARLSRGPGVAAVTAGPGVFNAVNAVASAQKNGSALVLLGGRAPQWRWGRGSLQEVDHVPVLASLAKAAWTAGPDLGPRLAEAIRFARTPPRGPLFVDFPLDLSPADLGRPPTPEPPPRRAPDPELVRRIAALVAGAERPVLVAGSGVWADGAWGAVAVFAETAGVPVFANGMGRGVLPAEHPLAFSRSRGLALRQADLLLVAGAPVDFRLGFGDGWASDVRFVHLASAPELLATQPAPAVSLAADLDLAFGALAGVAQRARSGDWRHALREEERRLEATVSEARAADREPIHPLRVYGELAKALDPDALVVGDGGDFVSYAGRELATSTPGSFLDAGPLGCLGAGPGAALAARLLHPDRQVVLLAGDGAFGFAALDFETFVRHKLPVVVVLGNNAMWALEKHLMRKYFDYDVVADLSPATRYDKLAEALGGHGELVTRSAELGPALRRAFAVGGPALLDVRIDPAAVYPRSADLF